MMAVQLLRELKGRGAVVRAVGDRIRIEAPRGTITDELRSLIREHKTELLRLLNAGQREAGGHVETERSAGVTLALSLRPGGRCWCCGQSRWWLSVYGVLVCSTCHPPAVEELVKRYLDGKEAAELVRLNEGRC